MKSVCQPFFVPMGLLILLVGPVLSDNCPKEQDTSASERGRQNAADHYGAPLPPGARLRIGRPLRSQSASVWSVVFSPDGKFLASTQSKTIRLWEVATGKELRRFVGHPAIVASLAFSPDGKTLASLDGNRVCLWEVATGKRLRHVDDYSRGRDHAIFNYLAFSPDGKTLATGGFDKVVRLWEAATLQEIRRLQGHQSPIRKVVFSRDGRTLASAGDGRTVRVWEVASGQQRRQFRETRGSGLNRALALTPDGKILAISCGRSAFRLLDVATGRELRRFETTQQVVNWLEFSPDGKTLSSGSLSSWFSLWDVATGKELRRFSGHRGPVSCVALSPDGTLAASGSWDQTIRLWEVATGKQPHVFPGQLGKIHAVAVSPKGRTLATLNEHTLQLWNGVTGKPLRTLCRQPVYNGAALAFSPDGRFLVSSQSLQAVVRVWNVATGKEFMRFRPRRERHFCTFALSPDGLTLASADEGGVVSLVDFASGRVRQQLTWYRRTQADIDDDRYPLPVLVFSPDGRALAVAGRSVNVLGLWDTRTGKKLRHFETLAKNPGWRDVAFSADGRMLATVRQQRRDVISPMIALWEVATGQVRHRCGKPGKVVRSVAWFPDGRTLISGGQDGRIRFWDAFTGQVIGNRDGHVDAVSCLAVCPDGKHVVSGSVDTTLLVWEMPKELHTGKTK